MTCLTATARSGRGGRPHTTTITTAREKDIVQMRESEGGEDGAVGGECVIRAFLLKQQ